MSIKELSRDIPVYDSVDVLVAGGGIAGCTAALAAARAGAKTMLIERNGCLGGVLVSNIIPNFVNSRFDVEGRHLVDGIPREIMDTLVAYDGAEANWNEPYSKMVFDEQKLKVVLIDLLQQAGVTILTHVLATRPVMDGNLVEGVYIETKTGRKIIKARVTVDCTGEADLAYQTGCPMRETQGTCTLAFKMSNVNFDETLAYFQEKPEAFPIGHDGIRGLGDFAANIEYGKMYFPHRGGRKWDLVQEGIARGEYSKKMGKAFGLDMTCLIGLKKLGDVSINSMLWRLESLDPKATSEAELEMTRLVYYVADFYKKTLPGFKNAHVSQISQDLGIRVSRALDGVSTLTSELVNSLDDVHFDDVVAVRSGCPWGGDGYLDHPFDQDDKGKVRAESVGGELTTDGCSIFNPSLIDISYGIILPQGVENLLVGSGKSVSCIPQPILRCGTNSMKPGQAAGAAAAVAALSGTTPRDINIRELQRTLVSQGVFLGRAERLAELGLE